MKFVKMLSMIVAVAIIASFFSIITFAIDSDINPDGIEIISLRESNVKHYLMPDGTYKAVVYSHPIHLKNGNGEWVEYNIESAYNVYRERSSIEIEQEQVFYDTYISSASPNTNYGSENDVQIGANQIGFFRIRSIPVPENAMIISAGMDVNYYFETSSSGIYVQAFQVIESWGEVTLTWNDANEYRNLGVSDSAQSLTYLYPSATASSPQTAHFDITNAARNWCSEASVNYGIAISSTSSSDITAKIMSYESGSDNRAVFTFSYSLVDEYDPLHTSNISNVRLTRIDSGQSSHILAVTKSDLIGYDIFTVINVNNSLSKNYVISDQLKNKLLGLEESYHSYIPTWVPDEEMAAHTAKQETDQLVTDGYISSGSSAYYGAWASNYENELYIIQYLKDFIDTATAIYGVYLSINSFYYSYLLHSNMTTINISSAQYNNAASYLDDIDDAIGGSSYTNKVIISAEERNAYWQSKGYTNPLPYKAQTPVARIQQSATTQYVRVYTDGVTSKNGSWIMKYSDIQGLTPSQIQSKFALPNLPTHYCYVSVPNGTTLYVGMVNESSTVAVQFELGDIIANSCFGAGIPLS